MLLFEPNRGQKLILMSIMVACGAFQTPVHGSSSKLEIEDVALQRATGAVGIPAYTSMPPRAASTATNISAVGKRPSLIKDAAPSSPSKLVSGTFRLAIVFDKGVKVRVKSEAEGGAVAQPDGSQISLLEILAHDGKIVKCVQTSLKGAIMAQQPTCSSNDTEIKVVFADEKAAFNATMEAVVRPNTTGVYKGPLLVRAIVIPDGKRIGELSCPSSEHLALMAA